MPQQGGRGTTFAEMRLRGIEMLQDSEGFAVIWRNAQRRRGEMLGVWLHQVFDRLRKPAPTVGGQISDSNRPLAHSFHLWRPGAAFGKPRKI